MWKNGIIDAYCYEVKVFDEPSKYGIEGGKISKLYIYTNNALKCVCQFDRKWVIKPTDEIVIKLCELLVAIYN